MRATTLFFIAAAVFAQDGDVGKTDPFVTAVQVFESAKKRSSEPGAHAVVVPAVERLVATNDVRAIQPLCIYLLETNELEAAFVARLKAVQRRGAAAADRMSVLEKELVQLRMKERAGDTRVGPQIEQRMSDARRQQGVFEAARNQTGRLQRQIEFIVSVRERLAVGCSAILASAKDPGAVDTGLAQLRRAFDVADHEQALYCVRILRDSKQPAAERHLLQILAHPKVDEAVTRATTHALGTVLSKRGAQVLLDRWQRDPARYGADVQHVLSIVARARLADAAAAAKWVESLPE